MFDHSSRKCSYAKCLAAAVITILFVLIAAGCSSPAVTPPAPMITSQPAIVFHPVDAQLENNPDATSTPSPEATASLPTATLTLTLDETQAAATQSAFEQQVDQKIIDLHDDDSQVCIEAAKFLSQAHETRVVDALVDAMVKEFDSEVFRAEEDALGAIKGDHAIERLIAALKDDSLNTDTIEGALSKIGPSAVEPLLPLLKDKNGSVRSKAAHALAGIKDPRAVEPLIEALRDSYDGVRMWAAAGLGELKDPRAIEPLMENLKVDNQIPWHALQALVKIGPPAVPAVSSLLKNKDPIIREQAALALGKIQDLQAFEPLIKSLSDTSSPVRIAAARALYEVSPSQAGEKFLEALKGKNLEIIAGAYKFYIARGEAGSESVIIDALNHNGDVYFAEALLNCGNPTLEDAAKKWASENHYSIQHIPDQGTSPHWGGGQ